MFIDITNVRYGRLVALSWKRYPHGNKWLCKCDCGNTTYVYAKHLKDARTRSCGCFLKEVRGIAQFKHGHSGNSAGGIAPTKTYSTWLSMIARCYNPRSERYKNYGRRGIIVCDRWLLSFENFLSDMGEKPVGLTFGRKDNDGNYEPSNCEWQTPLAQANNKSTTRWITLNGQTKSLAEWCREFNIPSNVVVKRITTLKHSPQDALKFPYQRGQYLRKKP